MNKNTTFALSSEVSVDAHELTDAELMQVQGGGGNNCHGGNRWHGDHRNYQFQGDCDDQRFHQEHYSWKGEGRDDLHFQGNCDSKRFLLSYQSWGSQGECVHWSSCQ